MSLTITRRLALLWVLAVLALAVMGGIVAVMHDAMDRSGAETKGRFRDLAVLNRVDADLIRLTLVAMDSIVDREAGRIDAERLSLIDALTARLKIDSRKVVELADTEMERAAVVNLVDDVAAVSALITHDLRRAIETGADKAEFDRLDDAIDQASEKVEDPIKRVRDSLAGEMDAAIEAQERASTAAWHQGIGVFVVSLGVLSGLFLWLGRSISLPLQRLTATTRAMAAGERRVEVPGTTAGDEIGEMARSVEVFRQGLIRADSLQAEQETAKAEAESRRRQDLRDLAERFEGDVNGLVETVGASAGRLHATAGDLSRNADQSGDTVSALAGAAQQTAANVDAVAAASEQLAASIAEISRQMSASSAVAGNAAQEAGRVNQQAAGLADVARRIGDVVGLISTIAGQTNLLVLNATIEAARAGETKKTSPWWRASQLWPQTAKATERSASRWPVQAASRAVVEGIAGISDTITQISGIAAGVASAVEQQRRGHRRDRPQRPAAAAGGQVSHNVGRTAAVE